MEIDSYHEQWYGNNVYHTIPSLFLSLPNTQAPLYGIVVWYHTIL